MCKERFNKGNNIVIYEYSKPKYNINSEEFFKNAESGKLLDIQANRLNIFSLFPVSCKISHLLFPNFTVDERRKAVGLESMGEALARYGLDWEEIKHKNSMQVITHTKTYH